MFASRKIVIATNHGKEKVMAPILEKHLGVECIILDNLDTDKLGTFTGEIERLDANPAITARKKCEMAMELANCDMAIANEGSFGPHPYLFFVPSDDEVVFFYDKKNNVIITEREISTETNFFQKEFRTLSELNQTLTTLGFPEHGLIVRKSIDDFTEIHKGITCQKQLLEIVQKMITFHGQVYIETDMRAMFNPSRMKVIERATLKLVQKINSRCDNCNFPGFGVTAVERGLPCGFCNLPTQSTFSHIYKCSACNFEKEVKYPNGKKVEDPMYCQFCNP